MFCPFCGHENIDSAKFCQSCGRELSQTTPQQQPQTPPRQTQTSYEIDALAESMVISKFSWGAFCFQWIWGIVNNVWISLLSLIPLVNIIMMFILGVKGRQWAWETGKYSDIRSFEEVQNKWDKFGIVFMIVGVVGMGLGIGAYFAMEKPTQPNAMINGLPHPIVGLDANVTSNTTTPAQQTGPKLGPDGYNQASATLTTPEVRQLRMLFPNFRSSDDDMNAVYTLATKQVNGADKKALRDDQKAWIAERDKTAMQVAKKGSKEYVASLVSSTDQRAQYLRSMMGQTQQSQAQTPASPQTPAGTDQ